MKFKSILIFLIIVCATLGFSKPRVTINTNNVIRIAPTGPNAFVLKYKFLRANNISSIFWNSGVFDQDPRTQNTPGFEWPKGSGKNACFTAGLSIGCYIVNNAGVPSLAECMASYKGEYVNGGVKYVNNQPIIDNDAKFRMYDIKAGDNSLNNPDWDAWTNMIPYGAPYEDVNHNGQYDPGIDVPGQKNAGQTIFQVLTDADSSNRNGGEGFGGGITSPLMYAEIHFTAWAYNTPGLEDLQFVNWVVINKGIKNWDSTFTGVVVDPDLGTADDDYIGCDTTNKINLGYVYNGTASDIIYGSIPPAFGMDYFKSPIIRRAGFPDDTLGMTSFTFFTNSGSSPPPCESDPNGEPYPAYVCLKGLKKDGSPFLDATQYPTIVPTKFCYTGDPETNAGWTEYKGSIQNCGGIQGNQIAVNPPGDRRFIFASGRTTWTMQPGDTQNIVLAQFVAKGTSNKNSVTVLKRLAKTAKLIYLANFNVTPPPPPPVVATSFTPLLNGKCNISLNWGDVSEAYRYWDSIFFLGTDSNIYEFQGYEVYELNRFFNGSFPDFSKPETIDTRALQLIDSWDLVDGWGVVVDTFSTGAFINGVEQYGTYSIVPPYKMSSGSGFPEKGIKRGITLTSTRYPENYGGNSNFIYGQDYQFAVVAYGISKSNHLKRGFRVIRNSVQSQAFTIRPIMPPAGSEFTYKNGDTLNTNVRDLGFIPIIRNQNLIRNATYRVIFNPIATNGDTTYNIYRLNQGATVFDTLYKNVYFTGKSNPSSDMSSKTADGILFKMSKIRYSLAGAQFDATKKVGVIKDWSASVDSDSSQARYKGWEYKPASNRFLEGSQFKYSATRLWQSTEMSLSYPGKGTYNDLTSKTKATDLKKVKIVFSNTNKSFAYKYKDAGGVSVLYKSMVSVPFQAFEMDFTDSTAAPVQLNVGIIDTTDTGGWNPTSDSLGGKFRVVIFSSAYDTSITSYRTNIYFNQSNIDIAYIWAPKLIADGRTFVENDEFWIYPYTLCIPFRQGPNYPLYYEFSTTAPTFGDPNLAKNTNALDKIRVVPNPYYGFSTLDRSVSDKFVTFRNLPLNCTIKIYTLNGDLIRTLVKTATGSSTTSSTIEWNLQNLENTPVASGVYIAFIDAPGIGTKVLKIAIFTSQERINF
ncbi:MAG: hypothetical protein HY959_09835 [Ignavibacteriae bacterium]|nr:hypothetical protein [Ignavibacteriota bacterium]